MKPGLYIYYSGGHAMSIAAIGNSDAVRRFNRQPRSDSPRPVAYVCDRLSRVRDLTPAELVEFERENQ